jgi:hypothetical protein
MKGKALRSAETLACVLAATGLYSLVLRRPVLNWGATDSEAHARLPGDELLREADGVATRAQHIATARRLPTPSLEDERIGADERKALRCLSTSVGSELTSESRKERDAGLARLGLRPGNGDRPVLEVDVCPDNRERLRDSKSAVEEGRGHRSELVAQSRE